MVSASKKDFVPILCFGGVLRADVPRDTAVVRNVERFVIEDKINIIRYILNLRRMPEFRYLSEKDAGIEKFDSTSVTKLANFIKNSSDSKFLLFTDISNVPNNLSTLHFHLGDARKTVVCVSGFNCLSERPSDVFENLKTALTHLEGAKFSGVYFAFDESRRLVDIDKIKVNSKDRIISEGAMHRTDSSKRDRGTNGYFGR